MTISKPTAPRMLPSAIGGRLFRRFQGRTIIYERIGLNAFRLQCERERADVPEQCFPTAST